MITQSLYWEWNGTTSKTVSAKGWARYSEDWSTFFLLSPFKSTLQSMCSFESTQYSLPLIRSGRKTEKTVSVIKDNQSRDKCTSVYNGWKEQGPTVPHSEQGKKEAMHQDTGSVLTDEMRAMNKWLKDWKDKDYRKKLTTLGNRQERGRWGVYRVAWTTANQWPQVIWKRPNNVLR